MRNKEGHQYRRNMRITKHMQARKDVRSVVIQDILWDLNVQLASSNAEIVTKMDISVTCAARTVKGLWSQDHPKHTNLRLAWFVHKIPYVASQKI